MNIRRWFGPLDVLGMVVVIASAWLACRIAWEQTVLTWENGPQMVGFSLMHSGTGVLLLVAFLVAGPIWIVLVSLQAWRNRSLGTVATRMFVLLYGVSWAVLLIPEQLWERVFIDRMARSTHATELLYYAAVRGDIEAVKGYIEHGVSVNSSTCSKALTPINGAARGGDIDLVEYLIAQGAEVNATNAYGDSPLCDAEERGLSEVVAVLSRHGGMRIVGSEAQRHVATREFVSRPFAPTAACAHARQGQVVDVPCSTDRWKVR
jgi:hypothetical protein